MRIITARLDVGSKANQTTIDKNVETVKAKLETCKPCPVAVFSYYGGCPGYVDIDILDLDDPIIE